MSKVPEYKLTDLLKMNDEELMAILIDLRSELFELKYQLATHQLDDPMEIPRIKKRIQCVESILSERHKKTNE